MGGLIDDFLLECVPSSSWCAGICMVLFFRCCCIGVGPALDCCHFSWLGIEKTLLCWVTCPCDVLIPVVVMLF